MRSFESDSAPSTATIEFVSESFVATTLADRRCRVTGITATAGNERVRAEVPQHVDVSAVIEAFRKDYPDAQLTRRRETDRQVPLLTEGQLSEQLLQDLTDRQLQTLRTAHAMGYFQHPRDITGCELAEEMGITSPTLAQHLRAAEQKLLDRLFAE